MLSPIWAHGWSEVYLISDDARRSMNKGLLAWTYKKHEHIIMQRFSCQVKKKIRVCSQKF